MKKLIAMISALLISQSLVLHSQTWTSMPVPDLLGKWTITGINFPTPNHGWAVGYLYDIAFIDAITEGVIIKYNDGKWTRADVAGPSHNWTLHGVWFLDENTGWAFGQNKASSRGLLMKFKDGLWTIVDLEFIDIAEWIIYDAFFASEKEGWIAGGTSGKDGPVLYHYYDGRWEKETAPDFKNQTLLALHGLKTGVLFAGGFREGEFGLAGAKRPQGSYIISKTKSGWETAKLPLLSKNVITRDIFCLSPTNVYAVGWMPAFQSAPETGKILHFNGSKWSEMEAADVGKEWNIMSIAFESADMGWAVGYYPDKKKGLLLGFVKGKFTALSKKTEPQISDNWLLRCVTFDGTGSYYAAGSNEKTNTGIILKLSR